VPLWLGTALSERNLARLVEWGSGWMPIGDDPARLADDVGRLHEALRAAGREPAAVGVRAHAPVVSGAKGRPDLDATLARLPELARAGVTVAAFALARFVRRREEIPAFFEALAAGAPR
jgi:alkanesulfonate monooxygenase SsuD/methylene tetrahydromethanopterin reductase-like flavin-dependent oxidoreductase (luciferase family)